MKPIKTKSQMLGLAYILELSLLVCAMLIVWSSIAFDVLGEDIENLFFRAANCPCGVGVCNSLETFNGETPEEVETFNGETPVVISAHPINVI